MRMRFAATALSAALLAACQSSPNGPWLMQGSAPWVGPDGRCMQLRPLTDKEKSGFCYEVMTDTYQQKHHYETLGNDEFAFLYPHPDPIPESAYTPPLPEVQPLLPDAPPPLDRLAYIKQLYTSLPFDFNKAHLSAKNRAALQNAFKDWKGKGIMVVSVAVTGHTDSKGSASYNYLLSRWRAQSVAYYLKHLGVPGNDITAGGAGKDLPHPEARSDADNRYVDLRVWLAPPSSDVKVAIRWNTEPVPESRTGGKNHK